MGSDVYDVLILGGGTAGITVAARLAKAQGSLRLAIVEPQSQHAYQPMWTLVGGGVFKMADSLRPEADQIPAGVTWLQDRVLEVDPERKEVRLEGQGLVGYRQLVVALGMQLDWHKVPGLRESLGLRSVASNYSPEHVPYTWEAVQGLKAGKAIFTQPGSPIKCAGAPQKALYLSEDHWRRSGHRPAIDLHFFSGMPAIFGVPKYKASLERVIARKGIHTHFRQELISVDGEAQVATFRNLDSGEARSEAFSFLHAVPPMSAPELIKRSPLADEAGWVAVDKHTTQHIRYPDVFSLGDCSSLPTSRTGAAIRKQAPVLVANLLSHRAGKPLTAQYDGYASCPLVTGYGSLILAEFDYDGKPTESFPFDQSQERYSMWLMKTQGLPLLYWHGMLRGRA